MRFYFNFNFMSPHSRWCHLLSQGVDVHSYLLRSDGSIDHDFLAAPLSAANELAQIRASNVIPQSVPVCSNDAAILSLSEIIWVASCPVCIGHGRTVAPLEGPFVCYVIESDKSRRRIFGEHVTVNEIVFLGAVYGRKTAVHLIAGLLCVGKV